MDLRKVIEATAGRSLETNTDGNTYVAIGSTIVYFVKDHQFDDEDTEWPDGTWIKLHSGYPYRIEIRDIERNLDRQLETGRQLYSALKDVGCRRLLLISDIQALLDHYRPSSV
ncbi:MAG TPA: hypothetical protein VIA06_03100 [Candidatus Dormibacteraeota bacterium]|nr:hypothetical protein [Candidatus Dormibacteraeota bacterium]